jgi:TonB family protein
MRILVVTLVLGACELATEPAAPTTPLAAARSRTVAHGDDVDAAVAPFPVRRSLARLPRAERLGLHAALTARLRMCVNARGEVSDVRVDEPSGVARFDAAALADVAAWRYEPFHAPDRVRVCEPVTIRYVP